VLINLAAGLRPWDHSWDEAVVHTRAYSAFRAQGERVCAGRAPGARERASFNPWVQGSAPWRPTSKLIIARTAR